MLKNLLSLWIKKYLFFLQILCQQRVALVFLPDCCCYTALKTCHNEAKSLFLGVVGVKLFWWRKAVTLQHCPNKEIKSIPC